MARPDESEFKYLDMNEEELLFIIGESLLQDTLSERTPDRRSVAQTARRWFAGNIDRLKKMICENAQVCAQFNSDQNDRNVLFGIIFDCLAGTVWGVPVGALTAQVLVYGLPRLCPNLGDVKGGKEHR
jgi:hypothetical protein